MSTSHPLDGLDSRVGCDSGSSGGVAGADSPGTGVPGATGSSSGFGSEGSGAGCVGSSSEALSVFGGSVVMGSRCPQNEKDTRGPCAGWLLSTPDGPAVARAG